MEEVAVPQRESNSRSLLKAISWRIIATLSTITIAWLIFDDVEKAISIGGVEFVVKFFIYYGHERLWQIIPQRSC